MVKNLPAIAGDVRDIGSIPGSGRSPGEGHGNQLQYSCLEKPHGQRSHITGECSSQDLNSGLVDSIVIFTRILAVPFQSKRH